MLVSGSHHSLVIKWLSNMFDFNTYIHMLGFVLWSGHVGAQDPGLRLPKSRLWGNVSWSCIDMSPSDGWLWPYHESIICDPSHYWMVVTIRWVRYDPSFWMFASIPWLMYPLLEILVMYMYLFLLASFPMTISGSIHLFVKNFTPHSCSTFML